MSFADRAGRVAVRRGDDPPDLGGYPSVRFIAPGSMTAGRFGLFEYRMAPSSPGPGPHVHATFSESFYVLSGELTIFDGEHWAPYRPGDYVHVGETGVHAFRNDADVETAFLILFAPGIARENFFTELRAIRDQGRELDDREWREFYARHDQ
ncbi:cupin domain-containing protein, partial [Pseudonocardia sp. N23]|uniref:cupin domain-containing protein n=1 Tax=Pseudonocardia sp. N23 TaxID=1987376 RepID=UPI000BFC0E7B